jgi:hypothetical protein
VSPEGIPKLIPKANALPTGSVTCDGESDADADTPDPLTTIGGHAAEDTATHDAESDEDAFSGA